MIELVDIKKAYEGKVILEDFSLHIKEGEMVAIKGKSGCGKSTLLNIIGLLETADKGQVCIDGYNNIRPQTQIAISLMRNTISYLFQNFALIDEETVFYNLKLALQYVKGNKKEKIADVLSLVELNGFEEKKIYQLSGGEQQRVALARILLKPSKIILADEPTGSLDPYNRDMVMEMLHKLQKQGKTIVIVTHDDTVAEQCDRMIEL